MFPQRFLTGCSHIPGRDAISGHSAMVRAGPIARAKPVCTGQMITKGYCLLCFVAFSYFQIHLKFKAIESERKRVFLSVDFLLKRLQWPGLSQSEARTQEQHLDLTHNSRYPVFGSSSTALALIRKLGQSKQGRT